MVSSLFQLSFSALLTAISILALTAVTATDRVTVWRILLTFVLLITHNTYLTLAQITFYETI